MNNFNEIYLYSNSANKNKNEDGFIINLINQSDYFYSNYSKSCAEIFIMMELLNNLYMIHNDERYLSLYNIIQTKIHNEYLFLYDKLLEGKILCNCNSNTKIVNINTNLNSYRLEYRHPSIGIHSTLDNYNMIERMRQKTKKPHEFIIKNVYFPLLYKLGKDCTNIIFSFLIYK